MGYHVIVAENALEAREVVDDKIFKQGWAFNRNKGDVAIGISW